MVVSTGGGNEVGVALCYRGLYIVVIVIGRECAWEGGRRGSCCRSRGIEKIGMKKKCIT